MSRPFAARPVEAVVIGGSAGAVEVLTSLLPALQPDCDVAVFVVVHIPRERPSLLATLFSSQCALPVVEAFDKQPIEAGTIYFAPPDYHLLVDAGRRLALSVDEPVHFSRPAIDVLFESAADNYADRLMGIVLSGANEDGAAGLRAIRQARGLTLVQQPATAAARLMPLAALRADPATLACDPRTLACILGAIRGGQLALDPATVNPV